MAEKSVFNMSPVEQLLGEYNAELEAAQSQVKPVEMPEPRLPAMPQRASRGTGGGKVPDNLLPIFEDAAANYNVPINVLMGLAEQESSYNTRALGVPTTWGRAKGIMQYIDPTANSLGINPYDPVQAIHAAAKQMRERLDKGYSLGEAVMAHHGGDKRSMWGPKTRAYEGMVLDRARRLGGQFAERYAQPVQPGEHNPSAGLPSSTELTPDPPAAPKPKAETSLWDDVTGTASDMAAQGIGGVYKGVGSMVRGIGTFGQIVGDYTTTPLINSVLGTDYRTGNIMDKPADAITEYGKSIQANVSPETQEAIKGSTPDGDLFDPSTWTLGNNPSVRGYAALGADILGGMLPIIAATFATGGSSAIVQGTTAGVTGGLQGGGAGVEKARQTIDEMANKRVSDDPNAPTVLEQESTYYRALREKGKSHEEAVQLTKDAAEKYAFVLTAPISGVGGIATSRLINPAEKILSRSNIGTRVAGRGALGGAEEGVQEVTETVQTNRGINEGAGTNVDVTEGTFGDAVLGFIGGGTTAAGAGAISGRDVQTDRSGNVEVTWDNNPPPREGEAQAEQPAPGFTAPVDQPAAEVAPEDDVVAPESPVSTDPNPTPDEILASGGPMSRSMAKMVPSEPMEGDAPAPRVVVTAEGIDSFAGTMTGETDAGIWVRADDGNEVLIPHDQVQSGDVKITRAGETAPVDVSQPAEPTPMTVEPAPIAPEQPAAVSPEAIDPETGEVLDAAPSTTDAPASESATPRPPRPEPIPELDYSTMTEPELRARLKYVAQQGKPENGGWTKRLTQERRKIEAAIEALKARPVEPEAKASPEPAPQAAPEVAEAPAAEPAREGSGPKLPADLAGAKPRYSFGAKKFEPQFSSDIDRAAFITAQTQRSPRDQSYLEFAMEATGLDEDGVRELGQQVRDAVKNIARDAKPGRIDVPQVFQPRPAQGTENAPDVGQPQNDSGRGTELPGTDAEPATAEATSTPPAQADTGWQTDPAEPAVAGPDGVPAATDAADTDAALTADPAEAAATPTARREDAPAEPVKWFGSQEKADAYIAKRKLAGTHEVVQDGKRFEIRPRATADTPAESAPQAAAPADSMADAEAQWTRSTNADRLGVLKKAKLSEKLVNRAFADIGEPGRKRIQRAMSEDSVAAPFAAPGVAETAPTATEPQQEVPAQQQAEPELIKQLRDQGKATEDQIQQAANELAEGDETLARDLLRINREETVAPAAATPANDDRFANNKLFTADKVAAARARLKSKLGQLNSGIDPEVLVDGMTLAGAYIEAGIRDFSTYARTMIDDLGDGVKPYLLSFWEGARNYPGLDTTGMTSVDESKAAHSALMTEGVPASEAPAMGSEVRKPAKRTKKTGKAGDRTLTQDWGVDHIDGWTETADGQGEPTDYGLSGGVKDAFLKDARAYLNAVSAELIEAGFTPNTDSKGRPTKPVSVNEAGPAVSGDVSLTLTHPRTGANAYVTIGESALRGVVPNTPSGIAVMYRVSNKSGDTYATGGTNRWAPTDLSATDLAGLIVVEANGRIPAQTRPAATAEPATAAAPQRQGTGNDTGRNAADDSEPLAEVLQGGRLENEPGGTAETSDGLRASDPEGDGRLEDDRTGRGNSLDGSQEPVLPDTPAEVRPLAEGPVGRKEDRPNQLSGENPGNFSITEDFGLGQGTDGQKIDANLAAIRTLRKVQAENRFPTPEEQATMARYVGWGGLKTVFDPKKADATDRYGKAQRELKELLSPDEYRAANGSIRNAHYTAKGVVDAMWRVARHMGFNGGRVLEPTVGIGNFIGLQPADLAASSEWHASELDTVTGQMAAMLYPEANVLAATGFQDAPFADNAFDLAIGNPPFGQQPITDKSPKRRHLNGMKIHNYIIAKTGMHLRPGGVMSMVVTHRFLDTANPEARDVLAKDFKFLGAFRLPNDAFAANAGTEVVTDVVFLQKLRDDEPRNRDASWLDVNGEIEVDGKKIRVNRYYQENPTHILGRSAMDGTMYAGRRSETGEGEYTVHGDGRDLGQAIDELMTNGGFADLADVLTKTPADQSAAPAMLQQSDLPVGGILLGDDGKIMRRDLDDDNGNAVVEEITPDTLWKDQAAEWRALRDTVADIKRKAQGGRLVAEDLEDLIPLSRFAYKTDGTPKASPTKAEQAVYDLVDALAKPERFTWNHDAQFEQIDSSLRRKQLGIDGYNSLKGMLDLRNRTLRLIQAEMSDSPQMEELRADLNRAYHEYVKAHGFLSDPKNANLLDGDVGAEAGLEASFTPAISAAVAKSSGVPARKASAKKADILTRRVNFPYKEITSADTPADALNVSMSERGRVDLPYMAQITGKSVKEVIADLTSGPNPQLFFDPETNDYQEAERYLSGNVKHKLQVARENGIQANIKALEAVQPAPKTKEQVKPNIRGMWMPEAIFEEFLAALGVNRPTISTIPSQGMMSASGDITALSDFGVQFKHNDRNVVDMFNAAAAGRPINVMRSDGQGGTFKDETATKEVNALVERLGKVFEEWAYSDEGRVQRIVDAFNEKMNTHVPRKWDGVKYLKTVGASPSISLRRTQKDAAWRMIQEKTMLADHVVGAGKTFTLITGIMERRRLGLSRKPMVAVPNHLVTQWARDFYKLYPGGKILAATPADFARKNRRRLFARIATGDFDAIIVGHTSIGFMETPTDDLKNIVDEKLAALREAMETARTNNESKRTLGQMQDRIDRYEQRLEELAERKTDDIGIDFKALGVDYLAVDEAHEFKNLEYSTAGERVVGMNDPNGSKRAFDLYSKVRGLLARDGGVTFATGTPVSNSLVEIYTMMSYLAHDELVARNQEHFDAWSGAYAATETRLEYTATQKLKPRRVLAGLNNLSALRQLYEHFADIITMDDLKRIYTEEMKEKNRRDGTNLRTEFPVPKVAGGSRQLNSSDITDAQREYMDYLVARMEAIEQKKSDKEYAKIDNALNVLTDARKMSLDIRIVDPSAPRDENGKVMRAANSIKEFYDRWEADRGTQMVFCDLSTPAKTSQKEAKRLISATADKLFGKDQAKQVKRQLDGKTFEQQWTWLKGSADELMDNPALDEAKRDEIATYFAEIEDAEATMSVADIGFSVYDDLKQVLIEKGIPASEIAFIHDFNTPEQKEKLFDRVNEGYVRVLIGSSAKMGAGTNAQRRLVALHHMDAPWRPSDVEQREGRIIRQGNMLYERDPDGFEVAINAYSTNNTSDTVMWQILERKAGAIEQFRSGGLDTLEEEGSDANQYAEFMASSTGNPVFRLKLEAERRLTELESEIGGKQIVRSNARAFMRDYPSHRGSAERRVNALATVKADTASYGGESGTAAEFDAALEKAEADYQDQFAEYQAKRAEAAKALAAWEKQPEATRGKKPAEPSAPSRPGIFTKSVQEASGYARAVGKALKEARKDASVFIDIGNGAQIEVEGRAQRDDTAWTLTLRVGEDKFRIDSTTAKEAASSSKLAMALRPSRLKDAVMDEREYWQQEGKRLDERRKTEEARADLDVDATARDEARQLLDWYENQVRFAEVEADIARGGRKNRYISSDRRRSLSQGRRADRAESATYDIDGETYTTTGIASGSQHQATRDRDGMPAIVRVLDAEKGERVAVVQPKSAAKLSVAPSRNGGGFASAEDLTRHLVNGKLGGFVWDLLDAKGLVLHADESTLPADREIPEGSVQAATMPDGKVHVVASNLNTRTALPVLLHEIFHAGTENLIGTPKWNNLMKRMDGYLKAALERQADGTASPSRNWWDVALTRLDAARTPEHQRAEELAAYAIENREAAPAGIREVIDNLIGTVKAFVLRRFGVQMGNVTPGQLRALAIAALRETPATMNARADARTLDPNARSDGGLGDMVGSERANGNRDAFYSLQPTDAPTQAEEARWLRDRISDTLTKSMGPLLATVPLRPLLNEIGKNLPAAQQYLRLKQAMDTKRSDWHAEADKVSQRWLKYRVFNRAENQRLMDLMHETTLAQTDPSKPFQSIMTKVDQTALEKGKPGSDSYEAAKAKQARDRKRATDHAALKPRYDALSPEAKEIYQEVRDSYKKLSDEFERVLLANMEKSLDIQASRAEREHADTLKSIADEGLTGKERDDAIAAADKKLRTAKTKSAWNKGARMTRMRAQFETNTLEGPYFPLARFGKYFVTVRDKESGEVLSFSRFESPTKQRRFIAEMRANKDHDVQFGVLDDTNEARKQVDARFVADIETILEGADAGDALKDQVWQRWLDTLPDMSVRKNRIHRKGRAGYTQDALRAYGSHLFHGAHQVARLQYAMEMGETIDQAREQAARSDDPVRAGLVVNEIAKRNAYVMQPTGKWWAQFVTSAAFFYYLSVSPAAALVNTSQTVLLGVPILAAFEGNAATGSAKASAQLIRATRDFVAGKGKIGESKRLTAEEKAAVQQAYDMGLIDRTQSHDLAGVGESGVEYSSVRNKLMSIISWQFHHTERFNREVTFLASYRMAKGKGMGEAEAFDAASDLTWKTHFDYQNTSRPRIMHHDVAKTALVFRNFNINMLYRLFRDTHQAINAKDPAERKEALTQLGGITAMMALNAGVKGTWLFGIAMVLAGMFGADDPEEDLKRGAVELLGPNLAGMVLNGIPGHLTGTSLSGRIGMPDLWFRSPDRQLEGEDEYNYWMSQVLGAGPGILQYQFRGLQMIKDGNVYRGLETMSPKFWKDAMRAYRFATDGATTMKGEPLLEEMSALQVVTQGLGFTPAALAERYETNRAMKNREKRILDARGNILTDFDRAIRKDDQKEIDRLMKRVDEYNNENPDYAITGKSINQSLRSRQRSRDRMDGGAYINPRLNDRIREEAAPTIYK